MQPYITDAMRKAVADTLNTRWIGQGPRVREFEKRFSDRMEGREAVAVGSCTDALHLAYILAGIKAGDDVLVPLMTCTATNLPLIWMGANLRFYDVAPNSLNADLSAIEKLITERTKAVVIVHYGGSMPRFYGHQYGVPVIEDAAQALGSNSIGVYPYCCFSFQAVKHVTTGDGGMLLVPWERAAEARRRRWFGIDREAKLTGTWANDITEVGFKYQMTDIAASMGIAGLESLDEQIAHRRKMLRSYCDRLANIPGIRVIDAYHRGAAWLCTVLAENREGLKYKLAEHSIESDQVHYRNDRYTVFSPYRQSPGSFPNMDAVESRYLVLPLHMGMNLEDVERVCSVIREGW